MRESEVERQYRDMRIMGIGGGTNEILTGLAAKTPRVHHMSVLTSAVDPSAPEFRANRDALLTQLAQVEAEQAKAVAGGGEKYSTDTTSAASCWPASASSCCSTPARTSSSCRRSRRGARTTPSALRVVTGIGVVNGVECMISASDPTVRGGASNPWTLKKVAARRTRSPTRTGCRSIGLVESGGADLPTQKEIFIPGGRIFRDLTSAVGGGHPDDRARVRQLDGGRRVHPRHERLRRHGQGTRQGVPRRAAAGEDGDRRGRPMTSRSAAPRCTRGTPGSPTTWPRRARRDPYRPRDRRHGSTGASRGPPRSPIPRRRCTTRRNCSASSPPTSRCPFDPREVIARIVDGSEFDEFKPLYGSSLVTGWATLHGYPDRHPRQRPRRAVQRGGAEGGAVHPAGQPRRHPAAVPAEHDRLHGGRRVRAAAASSSTAR